MCRGHLLQGVHTAATLAMVFPELSAQQDALAHTTSNAAAAEHALGCVAEQHHASMLAMALRKLNASYTKHIAELADAHACGVVLERELEYVWALAEDVAVKTDEGETLHAHAAGHLCTAPPRSCACAAASWAWLPPPLCTSSAHTLLRTCSHVWLLAHPAHQAQPDMCALPQRIAGQHSATPTPCCGLAAAACAKWPAARVCTHHCHWWPASFGHTKRVLGAGHARAHAGILVQQGCVLTLPCTLQNWVIAISSTQCTCRHQPWAVQVPQCVMVPSGCPAQARSAVHQMACLTERLCSRRTCLMQHAVVCKSLHSKCLRCHLACRQTQPLAPLEQGKDKLWQVQHVVANAAHVALAHSVCLVPSHTGRIATATQAQSHVFCTAWFKDAGITEAALMLLTMPAVNTLADTLAAALVGVAPQQLMLVLHSLLPWPLALADCWLDLPVQRVLAQSNNSLLPACGAQWPSWQLGGQVPVTTPDLPTTYLPASHMPPPLQFVDTSLDTIPNRLVIVHFLNMRGPRATRASAVSRCSSRWQQTMPV
jgi:hypothetical protein